MTAVSLLLPSEVTQEQKVIIETYFQGYSTPILGGSFVVECPVRSPSREAATQDLKTIIVEKEHCSYSDLTDRKMTPRRVIHVNSSLEVETEILQLFKNRRRLRGFEPIDLLDLIVRKGLTHPHALLPPHSY